MVFSCSSVYATDNKVQIEKVVCKKAKEFLKKTLAENSRKKRSLRRQKNTVICQKNL